MSIEETRAQWKPAPESVATVSTDDVPMHERFDWWVDMVDREVTPVSTPGPAPDRFDGWAQAVHPLHSRVAIFRLSAMEIRRSAAEIRRGNSEDYYLMVVQEGTLRLEQRRNVAVLEAGDVTLYSTSLPLSCAFGGAGRHQLALVRLPRAALPLAPGRVDGLLAERLPGTSGRRPC
ncbi:hypothetical protein [Yinghuangia soli]|uniref:Transcription regulator HTH AraC- type ligand binding domain-containing protein n=1 Tax=Yinghuangia soli TaxID=2908204 RepID=A0AA41QA14_9ACTN|nr:hypothetical protein [Yinghuangia soli]MCF2533675.1 hypothetical protein [Yinghuangia soli]